MVQHGDISGGGVLDVVGVFNCEPEGVVAGQLEVLQHEGRPVLQRGLVADRP